MTTTNTCPGWCQRHNTHMKHSGTIAKVHAGNIALMQTGSETFISPPPELDLLTPSEARELADWLTIAADMADREAVA